MSKGASYLRATMLGEMVVKTRGISSFPIDLLALASEADISVMPKPAEAKGVSGMLIRVGNNFGIAYATHLDNPGFERFSIAHELGHFFLPGHIDAILSAKEIHVSRAGSFSSDRYEKEADHFASGLLMPRQLFVPEMRRAGDGIAAIEHLKQICNTSLLATAIRYIECTKDASAIILSDRYGISFSVVSRSLSCLKNIDFLKRGQLVPDGTLTCTYNRSPEKIRMGAIETDTVFLQQWLGGPYKVKATEEVVGLGRYGKTLTLLRDIELPEDSTDGESYEDFFDRNQTLGF